MSQLRKLNQTQIKEKGVAVVTPQRSYSNLLEDLIKDIVASNIILLIKFFYHSIHSIIEKFENHCTDL